MPGGKISDAPEKKICSFLNSFGVMGVGVGWGQRGVRKKDWESKARIGSHRELS